MALNAMLSPAFLSLHLSLSVFGSGLTYLLNRLASVLCSHVGVRASIRALVCILTAKAIHYNKISVII